MLFWKLFCLWAGDRRTTHHGTSQQAKLGREQGGAGRWVGLCGIGVELLLQDPQQVPQQELRRGPLRAREARAPPEGTGGGGGHSIGSEAEMLGKELAQGHDPRIECFRDSCSI